MSTLTLKESTTTDISDITYRGPQKMNQHMTASVLLQTGGGAIVDPKLALGESMHQHTSHHSAAVGSTTPESLPDLQMSVDGTVLVRNNGKFTMEHMKKLLRDSKRFEHVTEEQIERVRVIHDRFLEGASFSFNYNTLLFVASVLAGLGLVSNSTATIIASMLVSPLMGPVIGMAYGMTIMDRNLVKRALFTETISLLLCIVVGCLIGLTTGPTDLADDWPTSEMLARGSWQSFFVACPVAFFSGLGVAVAVLDDQTSSLVGVAISASLLPPAVNAGIMWVAYGFVKTDVIAAPTYATFEPTMAPVGGTASRLASRFLNPSDNTDLPEGSTQYEHDQYLQFGGVSMAITIVNIILIIVSSIFMFRLKEVLPIQKIVFWEDLRIARKIYQKRAVLTVMSANEKKTPSVIVSGNVAVENEEENYKS